MAAGPVIQVSHSLYGGGSVDDTVSGYGNVRHQVGASNADNPAFQPVIYDPTLPLTSPTARFSHSGLPTSTIARLYHSVASLTANGDILIAGSNPNGDVSTVKYATEYRTEILSPPYISLARPTVTGSPSNVLYNQTFALTISGGSGLVTGMHAFDHLRSSVIH